MTTPLCDRLPTGRYSTKWTRTAPRWKAASALRWTADAINMGYGQPTALPPSAQSWTPEYCHEAVADVARRVVGPPGTGAGTVPAHGLHAVAPRYIRAGMDLHLPPAAIHPLAHRIALSARAGVE